MATRNSFLEKAGRIPACSSMKTSYISLQRVTMTNGIQKKKTKACSNTEFAACKTIMLIFFEYLDIPNDTVFLIKGP